MTKTMTSKLMIMLTMIFVSGLSFAQYAKKYDAELKLDHDINLDDEIGTEPYAFDPNKGQGIKYKVDDTQRFNTMGLNLSGIENLYVPKLEHNLIPNFNFSLECSAFDDLTYLSGLEKINDEVIECFGHKRSAAEGFSNEGLLKGDKKVCDCLKTSKVDDIRKIMKIDRKEFLLRNNMEISSNINRGLEDLMGRVVSLRDGMMFQSDILFQGKKNKPNEKLSIDALKEAEEEKKISSLYSAGFFTKSFQSGAGQKMLQSMQGSLHKLSLQAHGRQTTMMQVIKGDDTNKTANKALERKIEEVLSQVKIPEANINLLSQKPFEEGQCVGPKEFMAKNQFPDDNEFYTSIANESFSPENWDYNALEKKLIDLTTHSELMNAPEIARLETRMRFLNRNPLFKNLFSANDDFDNYFENVGMTEKNKNELKDITNKVLPKKKQELFNIMKASLSPENSSCGQYSLGCKRAIIKNIDKFDEMTKKFFMNGDVLKLTNTQAEKAALDEITKFKEDPLSVEDVILPQGQKELEDYVHANTSKSFVHPSECNLRGGDSSFGGKPFPAEQCVSSYSFYCSSLEKAQDQAAKGLKDNKHRVKTLARETQNYFNPNYNENIELKKFNLDYCSKNRIAKDGGPAKSFNQFRQDYCAKEKSDPNCFSRGFENIEALKAKYRAQYSFPRDRNGKIHAEYAKDETSDLMAEHREIKDTSINAAKALAKSETRPEHSGSAFEEIMEAFTAKDTSGSMNGTNDKSEDPGMFANLASVMEKNSDGVFGQASVDSFEDSSSYSNIASPPPVIADVPKIENMSDESKEELLDQWKSELDTWKKTNKGNDSASVSAEQSMKAKIEALETLLAEQRKLTDTQYKLLNEAIANQQNMAKQQVAAVAKQEEETQKRAKAKSSNFVSALPSVIEDSNRSPASVSEAQFNTSGSGNGNSGAAASSKKSSSRSSAVAASTAESVAREEAKLVNLRRLSDGSITIESVNRNTQGQANAITVSVSDEQYRLLQTNPNAVNLSQIEKSIPKDQMDRLEKTGHIILVLQNGANPPFEVKVEKKDNKLVYKLKDNDGKDVNPVRRIYTRKALELQLRTQ